MSFWYCATGRRVDFGGNRHASTGSHSSMELSFLSGRSAHGIDASITQRCVITRSSFTASFRGAGDVSLCCCFRGIFILFAEIIFFTILMFVGVV